MRSLELRVGVRRASPGRRGRRRGDAGTSVVAAGETQNVDAVPDQIDLLSSMIGWQFDPPAGRYGNLYAIDEAFDTRQVLQWAGLGQMLPPRGARERGLDAPGARLLARAALVA